MSFQIQTQQINAGDSHAFTFPSAVWSYVYGISGFYISAGNDPTKLSTASISLSPSPSSDHKTITIEAAMTIIGDSSATNWVQVTVLAWMGSEAPSGIYLMNMTGITPGASLEPTGLDNPPIVGAGMLAGFNLSFSSGSSDVHGIGAAAGCTISPFSTTPSVLPVGEGLLMGTGNNPSSNKVDEGLLILTQAQDNVITGMYFDGSQTYSTESSTYGTNNYSVNNLEIAPTQVAVFLQSFYLQFQISSFYNPTPQVTYVTAGASGITLSETGFSFTSTRMLYDSDYPGEEYPIAVPAASLAATYFYVALAGPTVSGINLASGGTGGGTQVTITGENFTDGAVVYFGTAEATDVLVSSATELTATVPPGVSAGTVDVYVATPAGISQSLSFQYNLAAPTVTEVTPNFGPTSGGTVVSISGSGFANDGQLAITEVMFGSVAATEVSYDAGTQTLQVTSPATTVSGLVDIYVTNSQGTSAQSYSDQFTYSTSSDIVVEVVKVDVVETEDEKS